MTDHKQPPSTKEEVSDVLSSIRRLVSDELRSQDSAGNPDTSGLLTLENNVLSDQPPVSSAKPLVLSEISNIDDKVPPLSRNGGPDQRSTGPEPLDLARISEESNDPPLTSTPIRGAAHLPKPIGPVADLDKKPQEPDASLPLPSEGIANIQGMPSETKLGAMKKDDNISPFVLASLEKRQSEKPKSEESNANDALLTEATPKPVFVNPFARGRTPKIAEADAPEADPSADTNKVEPEIDAEIAKALEASDGMKLESDPEFASFQNAEKAFEELAKAAESLKQQSAFSGVRTVIEEAGFEVSGKTLPDLDKETPGSAAPDEPAPQAAQPIEEVQEQTTEVPKAEEDQSAASPGPEQAEHQAPFFDEAELRAIVTDIVREELSGELGEKLSRNIRKMVRRQVAIALSEDDGNSGILDD